MKIRLVKDEDYAAVARLHRQTIRNVNSKDYPEDIIHVWSSRTNAERFRGNADKCKRWVAIQNNKLSTNARIILGRCQQLLASTRAIFKFLYNKIIGFCDHSLDGEFWGLYVHKDYIGKGVGSRLLKTAEDSLKKSGFKKVGLKATITAKDFYKKHGYRVIKKTFHPIKDKKLLIFLMSKNFF
ncbi:MAG: GNAT family N-acetyltransferase [bacterium]